MALMATRRPGAARAAAARAAMFPPHVLREYTMLADGARAALIGRRGDAARRCFARWHDDTSLARPAEGTLAINSRRVAGGGAVQCREALVDPGAWPATAGMPVARGRSR